MEKQELKNSIINRVNKIEDKNILKSIEILLNSTEENIAKFLTLSNEKLKEGTISETEDFTDYIKEWVKSM
jgi:hypothetical protein